MMHFSITIITFLAVGTYQQSSIGINVGEIPTGGPTFILTNEHNITIDTTLLDNVSSAHSVFIHRCALIRIDGDAFKSFANMTEFRFTQNSGITKLPGNIFRGSRYLANIYLLENNLTYVEEETFTNLLNLKYLDVSMNKISILPPNMFNTSIMLTKLFIQRNELRELPEGIFDNASQLKIIDLAYNKIKKISSSLFKYNYQLEFLGLQGNKIKHLDYGIEHLNVKTFNLHSNPLDMENKKVIEVLKFLHSNGVKTGIHIPHHVQNDDVQIVQHELSTPSNYLLITLIFVTVLLSILVGYLIYIVKVSKRNNCMRYHNMQTLSREDLVTEDPWAETEINGNVIMRNEN